MYHISKVISRSIQPASCLAKRQYAAKELLFGSNARDEIIAGTTVLLFCVYTRCRCTYKYTAIVLFQKNGKSPI